MERPPREVLERGGFDPERLERLPWHDPIWVYRHDDGRIALSAKRGRSDGMLDWEAELLDLLEDLDFPSVRAVRWFGGNDHMTVDGVHYIARTWIEGRMLVEHPAPDLAAVGRFIARYHETASSLRMPQRPGIGTLPEVLPLPSNEQLLAALGDEELVTRFRSLVEDVVPLVADVPGDALPIHGDLTTRNIVADGRSRSIVGLIDFGMSMMASPVVELAFALGSTRPDYSSVEHDDGKVQELVGGYASLRTLGAGWAASIVDHARARPLLHIAVRAMAGAEVGSGALARATWLTANRDRMIEAIEADTRR